MEEKLDVKIIWLNVNIFIITLSKNDLYIFRQLLNVATVDGVLIAKLLGTPIVIKFLKSWKQKFFKICS